MNTIGEKLLLLQMDLHLQLLRQELVLLLLRLKSLHLNNPLSLRVQC